MTKVTSHKRIVRGKVINVREHNRNYQVKFVSPNTLKDYAGMNKIFGKEVGFDSRLNRENEIWIDRNLPKKIQKETIRHEIAEIEQMKKGKKYFKAHLIALRREKEPMESVDKYFRR